MPEQCIPVLKNDPAHTHFSGIRSRYFGNDQLQPSVAGLTHRGFREVFSRPRESLMHKNMGSLESILTLKSHGCVKNYSKMYLGFGQEFNYALLVDHSARVIFVLRLPVSHHGQSFKLRKCDY
jgi:hypothetical protein